jgi:hypothetical protein
VQYRRWKWGSDWHWWSKCSDWPTFEFVVTERRLGEDELCEGASVSASERVSAFHWSERQYQSALRRPTSSCIGRTR